MANNIDIIQLTKYDGTPFYPLVDINSVAGLSTRLNTIGNNITSLQNGLTSAQGSITTLQGYFDANGKVNYANLPNLYIGNARVMSSAQTAQDIGGLGNLTPGTTGKRLGSSSAWWNYSYVQVGYFDANLYTPYVTSPGNDETYINLTDESVGIKVNEDTIAAFYDDCIELNLYTYLGGGAEISANKVLKIGGSSGATISWVPQNGNTPGYLYIDKPLVTAGDQIVGSGTPGGGGGGGSTPYLTDLLDVIQGLQPSANKMLIWTSQGTNNAGTTGGWTLIDKSSVGVSTDATQSAHGLMSTADKIKLDSIQFGTQASDYIPITIGSTTKNVLTAHQSLAAYATQTWVNQQIDALPEPMVFKGSLGTGGTVTSLPAASSSNEGHTYKVITAGTYQSITAKVGDIFISTGSEWVLIPSGDEPMGTVTSVGLTVPTGLSVSGSPITTSGTFAITFASGYSIPTTANQTAWSNKYAKPSTGIPLTDLASGVQTSLGLADTAYQKPSTGIPATDLASAVQTNITNGATAYGYFSSGILPVSHGGTGKDTLTSGSALIGNGTSAVTLRAITNNTVATAVTANTNLITANTLYYHKGNSNIVTVGTITSGTWHGSTIDNDYITNHTITVGSTVFNLGDTKTSLAGLVNVTMTGTLKIGDAEITWDGTNGYLKINKPLLTVGDQIVGSGTPGGGGGSGSIPYLTDLQDVIAGITPTANKMLIWSASGTNNAGTTGGWTLIDKSSVGVTTNASQSAAGLMSSADKIKLDAIEAQANKYVLPTASASVLGGIKVGSGLSINASTGVLDATYSYTLPIASSSTLGGIKVGNNLSINSSTGVLDATYTYTLPLAANGTRGGIQIGYSSSGKNYAVQLSSEKAYVNVPWTDTTYKLKLNNADKGTTGGTDLGTFFAPTDGGTSGYILKGNGTTSAPTWVAQSTLSVGTASKLGSATVGSSTLPIYLNSGTATAITSLPEAYLSWGGKNFNGTYGPIDAAMVNELGACRTMFALPAGIVIEYSTDAGNTWLDYGAVESDKQKLFSVGTSLFLGKQSTSGEISTSSMLRITINTSAANIYSTLNKFVIRYGTGWTNGNYCTITGRKQSDYEAGNDVWTTFADTISISGWTGYNVINTPNITTYGNQAASQYGQLRFTFGFTTVSAGKTGTAPYVLSILGYGGFGWTVPSYMAKHGHIYDYNYRQDATFPGAILPKSNNAKNFGDANIRWASVYAGRGDFSGVLVVGNNVYLGNAKSIYFKDAGGSDRQALNLSSGNALILGYGTAIAEYNTYIDGNSIYLRYGASHTNGITLTSTGAVTIAGATTLSSTLAVTGLATLSGGATIPSGKTLKIGDATIEWIPNSGNGYLKIDKPLLTTGDQIVGSGTPSGGGGGGSASYLSDLLDLSETITDKPSGGGYGLVYSTSATDKNGNSGAWIYVAPGTAANISGANTTARLWSGSVIKSAIEAYGYVTSSGVTSVATGIGLTGGTITNTGTLKVKLKNETLNTADSAKSTSTNGGLYSIEADKSGNLAVRVPWVNTWNAASTSQAGYVPKLALASTATIATQSTEYVLTYISGTETAPVWRKLPANAFNNNTYTNGTGISLSGNTFSLNVAGAKTALGLGTMAYEAKADYVLLATAQTISAKHTFSSGILLNTASSWTNSDRAIAFSADGEDANIRYYYTDSNKGLTFNPSTGELRAAKFIKRGGTSSQFLKADGSVDSSTYLTGNQTITLSGDVSGSGTTSISVSIGSGKVTNAMLAGSIAWSKLSVSASNITSTLGTTAVSRATADADGNTISSTYVKKAGDTMSGDLIIEKTGGGLTIRGDKLNANADGGYIYLAARYSDNERNGCKIAAVYPGSGAYDIQDLVFYSSNNRSGNAEPIWQEAMRIKADKAVSMNGSLSISRDGVYSIYINNTASDGTASGIRFQLNGTTKGGLFVSSDENLYYSVGTASTGNRVLTSANYDSFALPLSAGSSYPLTGHLYLNEGLGIQAVGGVGLLVYHPTPGWSGIDSTQWGLGSVNSQGVIRSSNSNLLHYKGSTSYSIWDASNSNLSTVDWAANNLTAAGIGTFDRVVLSNSGAVSHIEFTRAGWNYISVPTDGVIAFNVGGSGSANTSMAVTPDGICAGTKGVHSCGLPTAYWGSIYGKDLYLGGDAYNTAAGSIIFSEKLDAQRNGFKIAPVHATSANRVNLVFYRSNNGNSPWAANWTTLMTLSYDGKVTIAGSLTTSGDQVISSDASLKKNWRGLKYGVADIAKATAGVFDWKDGKGESAGTKAQDWMHLVPQLVHGEEGHMTLAYGQIAMLNTILLARRSEDHETRIKALEAENAKLKEEIKRLKS